MAAKKEQVTTSKSGRHRSVCWPLGCIIIVLLTVTCSSFKACEGLRISSIEVPPAVMNSSQVTLVCNYDLQGDQLYSVKWYKNYVEFYRFQPLSADSAGGESQSADEQLMHSKHDFEWDGINLNLAKSNSTHVYLRQTNLASEGTYKCEVSADSPSFATVSIERQMKVYVLPKQKLSIIDNLASIEENSNEQTLSPTGRQSSSVSFHNMNDMVNLTCLSGPSWPSAKLTWLLNDSPIASTSKWLLGAPNYSSTSAELTKNSKATKQLLESRLTLAFRLQPNHLLGNVTSNFGVHLKQASVKFRCQAEFSLEFSSEASVLVSGGKTSTKVRAPKQQPQQGHNESSSHIRPRKPQALLASQPAQQQQQQQFISPYRWPRPAAPPGAERRSGSLLEPANTADEWLSSAANQAALDQAGNGARSTLGQPQVSSRQIGGFVVWANRQLRAQAEHIDQLLSLTRPNELEPPIIVAKILKFTDEGAFEDGEAASYDNYDAENATNARPLADKAAAAAAAATEIEWNGSHKFSVAPADSGNPSWSADNGRVDHEFDRMMQARAIRAPPAQPATSAVNQDYELNDVVQFTCISRIGSNPTDRRDLRKNVRLKWFINDKEITASQVNAYDGVEFFHDRPVAKWTQNRRPVSSSPDFGEPEQSVTSAPGRSRSKVKPSDDDDDDGGGDNGGDIGGDNGDNVERKTLQIGFSPTLFQLRELDLKCKTTVEQPLIEYENQLIASVPSSQFIEAVQQKHKVNPSLRGRQNGRSGYQQRNRSTRPTAPPSSSSSSSSGLQIMMSHLSMLVHWQLIVMTTAFVAAI